MARLHEFLSPAAGPAGAGPCTDAPPAAGATGAPAREWTAWWRRHWLIVTAVLLALVPRILVTLAFPPALVTAGSAGYLTAGLHLAAGSAAPPGYPFLLWLLAPFHSLLLAASVQHLMGIAIGVIGYAVLRGRGLPAWGAALAAAPTLFDSREVTLESAVLPGTVYGLLLMVVLAVLLSRRGPTASRCAVAGLLLAWSTLAWPPGALEMAGVLAVLLLRRAGWRPVVAAATAFAVPVLGYVALSGITTGNFTIAGSDGLLLWSRTMSFADCTVIKPTPRLRPLCPQAQPHRPPATTPAWSISALLSSHTPASYLQAPDAWWRHDAHPGFTAYNDRLATQFALAAIRAQPTGYLRAVASGVMLTFVVTDRPQNAQALYAAPAPLSPGEAAQVRAYTHTSAIPHPVQPFAYFFDLYQAPVYFPGIAFLLVLVVGLAGILRYWRRRGGPGTLPWVLALIGVVSPVALQGYQYQYAITAVPAACLAAGLAFAPRKRQVPAPLGRNARTGALPAGQAAPALTDNPSLGALAALVGKLADEISRIPVRGGGGPAAPAASQPASSTPGEAGQPPGPGPRTPVPTAPGPDGEDRPAGAAPPES